MHHQSKYYQLKSLAERQLCKTISLMLYTSYSNHMTVGLGSQTHKYDDDEDSYKKPGNLLALFPYAITELYLLVLTSDRIKLKFSFSFKGGHDQQPPGHIWRYLE